MFIASNYNHRIGLIFGNYGSKFCVIFHRGSSMNSIILLLFKLWIFECQQNFVWKILIPARSLDQYLADLAVIMVMNTRMVFLKLIYSKTVVCKRVNPWSKHTNFNDATFSIQGKPFHSLPEI